MSLSILPWRHSPAPAPAAKRDTPSPTPPPDDGHVDHLSQSAASLNRDGFVGLAGLTTMLPVVGPYMGAGIGVPTAITGFAELMEGRRNGNTSELLNGFAHIVMGSALTLTSLVGGPLTHAVLLGVVGMAIATKISVNHPTVIPRFFGHEAWHLAKDTAVGIKDLISYRKEDAQKPPPIPEPPARKSNPQPHP